VSFRQAAAQRLGGHQGPEAGDQSRGLAPGER